MNSDATHRPSCLDGRAVRRDATQGVRLVACVSRCSIQSYEFV